MTIYTRLQSAFKVAFASLLLASNFARGGIALADSCTHDLSLASLIVETKRREAIQCFSAEEAASEKSDGEDFNSIPDDPLYWRQGYKECTLAADLNGKLDSKLVWGEFPGIFASQMEDLKDCLSRKIFKRGGFLGIGATKTPCWDSNDPGFQLQPECTEGLCECNKDLLKGGDDLECSWSLEKFNCKTVEEALKKGGAALINIGDRDDKTTTGHTVQAVAVRCDEKGDLSKVTFRDPVNPERTTDATVCSPPCRRWHSADTRYNNMTAEGFYTIGQADRP